MYSHVACDVMKEQTHNLLKPSSLIWHLMPYLFLFKIKVNSGYITDCIAAQTLFSLNMPIVASGNCWEIYRCHKYCYSS